MSYQSLKGLKAELSTAGPIHFKDYQGQKVVIYFYPKDDTPGCTCEGEDFRDNDKAFQKANTVIFGVSRDALTSHEKFKTKFEFPFILISDPEEILCAHFEVMKDKNMYGKKVRGIDRSTFLFDEAGKLLQEWRKVKVEGHVKKFCRLRKNKF